MMTANNTKAHGLLLRAFREGALEPISWVDVTVGDLIVTVASDALEAPLGDQASLRLPVSYQDAIEICRGLDCVSPTLGIFDAMFAQAKAQLPLANLPPGPDLDSIGYTIEFNRRIDAALAKRGTAPGDLVAGAWKLWLLHANLDVSPFRPHGSVNRGFWDPSQRPPRFIQQAGIAHNDQHVDYSQVLQPVKRTARVAATGAAVDLLDVIQKRDRVPAKYLDVYRPARVARLAPAAPSAPAGSLRRFSTMDLLATLEGAGIDVAPVAGWASRGRPGTFDPQGILLHHTAGPRAGDAPSLKVVVDGRPDLAGPLCHILLSRSGTAHLVAAGIANHAGPGAREVLARVRRDAPVTGDARTHGYADAAPGNAAFYGIEVENSGRPDDPYPEVQIQALARICAALCTAHGWSANRVVHHRQWTTRKIDMSYRGDLTSAIAARMETPRALTARRPTRAPKAARAATADQER
ncbi:MAG: N-acetylmuramoyl-L-alanine amidase [Minicystis sp.]